MKKPPGFGMLFLGAAIAMLIPGCFEEESPFLVESTIDLQSPNGVYEMLLHQGVQEAFESIEWNKYQNKKLFYKVQEIGDGYVDNIVAASVGHKFVGAGADVLVVNRAGENKDKSVEEIKKETDYDYDLYITVPVAGVFYYEGFLKRNYISYVSMNLFEKTKDGTERVYSSGIIEKRFDKFIPSKVFVVGVWVFLLSVIILMIGKILYRGKHTVKS